MSYRTILLSLNDLDRNSVLLECAAKLAHDLDAHLQGLYVVPAVEILAGIGFEPVVLEEKRDLFRNAERSVRTSFEAVLEENGIRGTFDAVEASGPDITNHAIDRARHCDITIVSQPAKESALSVTDRGFVERVMLSSGRPTIVVPRTGKRTSLSADFIVVGWSGTREAARATFDSLPLLKRARKVQLFAVDPEKTHSYTRGVPDTELATTLARHGVNAVFDPISTGGREAGEVLLDVVSDSGAELLVMGAYGHSRISEMILGGATRTVLAGMSCPVLFSH
ncbi:universal stress protein [Nordella sp. HKS 07]|uniref:universal stress protein n=1 Tax=Nordella sp. HKS 07 TaxID=2712222 RepID=UPI0013E1183F|nr:universal stress protein [Nordella sp. HKS 07]QIG48896.1 universal stress protein [Nordella sp. HKS 07]